MKRQLKLIICCCLLLGCLALAACGQTLPADNAGQDGAGQDGAALTPVTMMLDWTPNTNHTGIYVAQALGYYEEAGLDVTIMQPSEDGAEMAVATGQAQFGVSFQEVLDTALAAEEPLPITAVAAVIDHNTSGLISLKEKNITSFKDLENATYASWNTPAEMAILQQCMENAGGDFALLNTVPNSGADALSLMQSGDIDVVWVYEGWDMQMAELAELEYNYISFREAAPVLDYYTPVLIAGNQLLQEQPDTVRAFLAATAKGYQYAIENPEEAAKLLCEAVPELDLTLVTKSQQYLASQYQGDAPAWGVIDQDRWTAFNNWFYEKGLIGRELASEGYTNDYLPQ